MTASRPRRAMIYARLSVTNEESVSVARQVEAAISYATARGWAVVAEPFIDDGVSATNNRPEDRKGWKALLSSDVAYDAVIVWKVDRLARRVIDFLHADESLQNRGAGLVCVEDPVDMTTAQGRAFATVLAVFGELEAASISARVAAARNHLLKQGRVVGGTIPYGWRKVANPDGAGFVLATDPERINYVRTMADMVLNGSTVYAVRQWASEEAPLPTASQGQRKTESWAYSTVERLLRNPILAGMTAHNPGNQSHVRGSEVLRDETGMPVIDESVAILTTRERRDLLAKLDGRDSPQARPRASKGATSPFLSGMVTCGHCSRGMTRGTTQGRPSLSCPSCHQTVSNLDRYVSSRLLTERGDRPMFTFSETGEVQTSLSDIEEAIQDTARAMTADGADVPALSERLANLKEARTEARRTPNPIIFRLTGQTVREAWEATEDPLERREILVSQASKITVTKGKTGRYFDESRLAIQWQKSELHLPDGTIPDESNGAWAIHEDAIYYAPR